jgi:magnesium chelatase subunit D
VCAAFDVDGLRADLVTARAAIAHAAWEGRSEVAAADVRAAARLALPHRRRRQPFDAPQLDESELDKALAGAGEEPDDDPGPGDDGPGGGQPDATPGQDAPPPRESAEPQRGPTRDAVSPEPATPEPATPESAAPEPGQPRPGSAPARPPAAPGPVFRVKRIEVPGTGAGAAGRRSRARTDSGHVTGAQRPRDRVARVHVPATFAAAAPYQVVRGRAPGDGLLLRPGDLREARHEGRESNLVLFAVDASGSMAARARMGAVKGAVLSLLLDAYQRRDKVGMVTFRGSGAEVALPPTFSVEAAAARLAAVPTGGRTPLAAGLLRAHEVLRTERIRDPRRRALLVLVTDGRATGGPDPVASAHRAAGLLAAAGVHSVVVDCESGPVRLGLVAALAQFLGGVLLRLEELAAGPLAETVRVLQGQGPVTKDRAGGSGGSPPRASTGLGPPGLRGGVPPGQHREVA